MKKLFLFLALILLTGCSTTQFYVTDDGFKVAENGSELEANDFNGTDFFIANPPNQYYKDLNAYAFSLLSNYRNHVQPANRPFISQKLKKEGEAVLWRNGEAYFVKFDDEKDEYDTYSYSVRIDNDVYNKLCRYISAYNELKRAESNCQWVLSNCQNPLKTITRQVSVPRTAYQTVTRSANTSFYGDIYGNATTYYTTVEPYTVYDTATEYVTIANPDYDPVKVDEVRQFLPTLLADIETVNAGIVELFPRLFHVEAAALSNDTSMADPAGNAPLLANSL